MRSELVLLIMLTTFVMCEEVSSSKNNFIEPRGKKKKIALFVYFADLLVKKLFIFKLVYAFILWVVIHKAGYFFTWFISYLKETKSHHQHEYDHHPHYEYGPPHHHDYGHHSSYEPYKRESWAN